MRKIRGRKLKRQKQIVILSLFLFMAFFATGYAAFSTKIRLNAKGNIKSINLTFDPNGGILDINNKRVVTGNAYGNLPTPIREGYIFKGWNGKNKFNKEDYLNLENFDIVPGNSYHSARITLKPNTSYKISIKRYNNFDGTNNGYLLIDDTPGANAHWTAVAHPTMPNSSSTNFGYTTSNDGLLYIGYLYVTQNNLNNIWENTDIQIEEGSTATDYEPYYVTSETTVTQEQNHTLTAIWEEDEQANEP